MSIYLYSTIAFYQSYRNSKCFCNFNSHKLQEAAKDGTSCKEVIQSLGMIIYSKRKHTYRHDGGFGKTGYTYDDEIMGSGAWESTKSDPGCTYYPYSGMGADFDYGYIGTTNYKNTGKWQLHQSSSKEVKCDGNSEGHGNRQRVCACSGSSPPPNTSYYILTESSSDLQGEPDNCDQSCQRRGHQCNNIMVGNCRSKPLNNDSADNCKCPIILFHKKIYLISSDNYLFSTVDFY